MESLMPLPWYVRRGWLLVLILASLMVLFGLYVLSVPVDASDFERATDVEWDAFSATSPKVAEYLEREARLLGVTAIAMGGFAAGLAGTLVRRGDRTAWWLLWLLPAALALYSIVFLASGSILLGVFYVVIAGLAIGATWVAKPQE
ncbi:MAG TPA: hypothetical protein VK960_09900 [Acidimicrobiia bacterium]|nr:hypothetical protein [Acidimicrobiia bacterium]